MKAVWEILIPAESNSGVEFSLEHHQKWDAFVKDITGGLTVMKSAKGQWVDKKGKTYFDKTIPCRIACSRKKIKKIIDFTIKHYEQRAVYAYKVSKTVIFGYKMYNQK
jgi:hypothetical protein